MGQELCTFQEFRLKYGTHACEEWDAAGATGINENEKLAIETSKAKLAYVDSKLRESTWETYAIRFDFDIEDTAKAS